MLASEKNYVATLSLRPSEMNALEKLPQAAKERIAPCFLLAPWLSSRDLSSSIDRIERAFSNQRYFLDIDRDYVATKFTRSSVLDFVELKDPTDAYVNWWDFALEIDNCVPCLQLEDQVERDLRKQIRRAQGHGREFCLRYDMTKSTSDSFFRAVDLLKDLGTADFSIIIEAGWVRDPLTMTARFLGLVKDSIDNLDGRIPIVISMTSMPKSYVDIEGIAEISFGNRQVVEEILRSSNRPNLVYGDWASTKPRDGAGGRTPPPRIDYPLDKSWIIAKNTEEEWSYSDAAQTIINSPYWRGDESVWGERLILMTARKRGDAIDNPTKNVAARINIHLFRQSMFGERITPRIFEEAWED